MSRFSQVATGAVADVPGGPRGYQVLVAITTEPPSSQLTLAHRLSIDETQMTYVVDGLEAGGFVERRPDARDRRVRQVHPTDAGRASLWAARDALRDAEGVLRRLAKDPDETFPAWQGMQYFVSMFSGQAQLHHVDNDRYGAHEWTTVRDVLAAHVERQRGANTAG